MLQVIKQSYLSLLIIPLTSIYGMALFNTSGASVHKLCLLRRLALHVSEEWAAIHASLCSVKYGSLQDGTRLLSIFSATDYPSPLETTQMLLKKQRQSNPSSSISIFLAIFLPLTPFCSGYIKKIMPYILQDSFNIFSCFFLVRSQNNIQVIERTKRHMTPLT